MLHNESYLQFRTTYRSVHMKHIKILTALRDDKKSQLVHSNKGYSFVINRFQLQPIGNAFSRLRPQKRLSLKLQIVGEVNQL